MPNRVPTFRDARMGGERAQFERHRLYDRLRRNLESKAFYNSAAWIKLREMKLNQDPLCQECRKNGRLVPGTVVHHSLDLRLDWTQALDIENLVSLCASCHSRLHAKQS